MTAEFVPSYSKPARNRRVLLVKRPNGVPLAEDFAIDEAAVPSPQEGQLLVRTLYLSVDPAQRGWASAASNYSTPVPLNTPMRALAVGVITASRVPGFAPGEFIYGWLGWQDYAVIAPDQIMTRIAAPILPLSAYAGIAGMNGVTAYLALKKLGQPVAGETVLVSTAAGAVGSVAGQLAHAIRCKTIGLAGQDAKVERCLARFGYDHAVNYKSQDIGEAIEKLAPEGIDVFFDNVGGTTLDTVLRHMRPAGRVIQCGTASVTQWSPPPPGLRNEREILTRRLIWSGFVIFDHLGAFQDTATKLAGMVRDGDLTYDEDIEAGIEAAPDALRRVYAGENIGKKLIWIGEDSP